MTDFLKCIENIGCAFDPRAPTDLELTVPYVYALRDIANIVNLSDQICTNGTQLHEGNHDKFNLHLFISKIVFTFKFNSIFAFYNYY